MKEYRIVWCQYPFAYNTEHVLFVEANSINDAEKVACNHIERKFGLANSTFAIRSTSPTEETTPVPPGRVK